MHHARKERNTKRLISSVLKMAAGEVKEQTVVEAIYLAWGSGSKKYCDETYAERLFRRYWYEGRSESVRLEVLTYVDSLVNPNQ